MSDPHVCFVVNAVGQTSVPADIAVGLARHTDVEVDLLAWFSNEPFDGDDEVGVTRVDAPDSVLGIDGETYRATRDRLGEYDLVQAHHNHSGSFAKVLARLEGVPVVSREGNTRDGFTRKGRIANGVTNPLADRVVCNSRAVYESFRRWERLLLPPSKIDLIPNGVDFERLADGRNLEWSVARTASVDPEAVLVATAGMLTEQKDHDTLIRAIGEANGGAVPIELVIAGDGPREHELKRVVQAIGLSDRVHFLGRLERLQVYEMMHEADVYAMPSKWEGFSAAAVEALGTATACVFSDIPPFRHPYDGVALFHPVGDHETLAERLVELATDPEKREDLGERGRELVRERYTMERVATAYSDLYDAILD